MASSKKQRELMVRQQIEAQGVKDRAVLEAMRKVPRELFLPDEMKPYAYDDSPLPIAEGQTISQPLMVVLMAAAIEVGSEDRVLEIGAGSGYSAAVLGHIAHEVHSVERFQSLVDHSRSCLARLGLENVHVHHGDGHNGWSEAAPYAGIVVTAAATRIPDTLLGQLAPGGRMVVPIGDTAMSQKLLRITLLENGELERESLEEVRFVPMVSGVRS